MLGTRGVPAAYSGFETCVEQVGKRLVARGHEVIVYCRPAYVKTPANEYLGMRLVKLPSIPTKGLEQAHIGILDCVGVALAGARQPAGAIGAEWARKVGGAPQATVWGQGFKTSAHDAALVNGTAGAVWAPGGKPRVVFNFTIRRGKIAEIHLVADPERLRQINPIILKEEDPAS